MSWKCLECGKVLKVKGSHGFKHSKANGNVVSEEIAVSNEVEEEEDDTAAAKQIVEDLEKAADEKERILNLLKSKENVAVPSMAKSPQLEHKNLCPTCGCVDVLDKFGYYTEPVQLFRCRMCGKVHQWNMITDTRV